MGLRVIILTEFEKGTAAHHLAYLLKSTELEIVQVVRSRGLIVNRRKFLWRKIKKAFSIGPFGVLNGFRMRKWFGEDVERKLQLSSLRDICLQHQIRYDEVERTNSEETVNLFREARADVGISLGNSFISKRIFSIPPKGMINIHHEILPDYQNAQSVIWQLYNGSDQTGYTIHRISPRIDGGDILYQQKIPILFKPTLRETIAETSVALLKASATGLQTVLADFDRYLTSASKQGAGRSYTTPSGLQYLKILRNYNRLKKLHGDK